VSRKGQATIPKPLREKFDIETPREVFIYGFTLLYLLTFVVATILILIDAGRVGLEMTILEALSASIATIGNIGPGFGFLGPFGSYVTFPTTSKPLLVFLM
jgi:trk system potassium uptake protein TrkH